MDSVPRDGYGRPVRGAAEPVRPKVRPLSGAANLSFELVTQLQLCGVDSLDRLEDLGAGEAWLRLRQQFEARDTFATLLALQGAIEETLVPFLPLEQVDELRAWWERHGGEDE